MTRLIFLLCICSSPLFAQEVIHLNRDQLGVSQCKQATILEDAQHKLTVQDVLRTDLPFSAMTHEVEVLDFNKSRWFVRFSITNKQPSEYLILEAARPITNKVILHEIRNNLVVNTWKNGDDFSFAQKAYPHRKSLFSLRIPADSTRTYILELESDGEVITLPLRFWESEQFHRADATNQLMQGLFYGILLLVAIIYFFFYRLLRDRSFLYYVLYVIGQFFLQFSLDGYTFQYLFQEGGYLTNHLLIFSAGFAVVFLLLYGQSYLKLKTRLNKMYRAFRVISLLVLIMTLLTLLPGPTYTFSFPIVNGLALIGTLLILASIFVLTRKGVSINIWFTSAFVLLIIGAVTFILGNFHVIGNPDLTQNILKICTGLEVIALSISMAGKYRDLQAEKEKAQEQVLHQLEEKNKLMDEINVRLERQVKERTAEIEQQKEQLAEKNEEILDSIRYAKRIQEAILPPDEVVKSTIPDSFILYMPRDIVSGDFYFVAPVKTTTEPEEHLSLFAAVDCTGHGVPGAFMSIVGNNFLNEGLAHPEVNTTGQALDLLNNGVLKTLRQESNTAERVRDGMDLALCAINWNRSKLYFSGAKNPMYLIRNGELHVYKGDKIPIGEFFEHEQDSFHTHEIALQKGDVIYIFSDGFADQFGGERGKKFTYGRFKDLLLSVHQLPMEQQKEQLIHAFVAWKGNHEQLDDVCVIGVRV